MNRYAGTGNRKNRGTGRNGKKGETAVMKRNALAGTGITVATIALFTTLSFARGLESVKLPPPDTKGGKPLMQALKERKTTRSFSPKELSPETLSNLLWAAFGINRPGEGKRTAPSAVNWQEIDIYVATAKGCYIYDPKKHSLEPHVEGDIRALTGTQPFVATAPVNLVFVADLSKMGGGSRDDKEKTAYADTGFISQNVYLFCASEGLATVVRGLIDKPALAKALKLNDDRFITLAQSVGHPK